MFKLVGWIFKAFFFAGLVLVTAHYVTWDGKTISDQVDSSLSSAEKSVPLKAVRKKSKTFLQDAKKAASHIGIEARESKREPTEVIPTTDRERLEAVIGSSPTI